MSNIHYNAYPMSGNSEDGWKVSLIDGDNAPLIACFYGKGARLDSQLYADFKNKSHGLSKAYDFLESNYEAPPGLKRWGPDVTVETFSYCKKCGGYIA